MYWNNKKNYTAIIISDIQNYKIKIGINNQYFIKYFF